MAQWYLYKCEVCGAASFANNDHGSAWYAECLSCKGWQYHDKIILGVECVYPVNRIVFMDTKDTKKEALDGEKDKQDGQEH